MGNEGPNGAMPFCTAGAGLGSRARECSIPSLEVEKANSTGLTRTTPCIGEHSVPVRGVMSVWSSQPIGGKHD
jgi:hypothetical protein